MPVEAVNSINTNLAADRAARVFGQSTLRLQSSIGRLSSGFKFNSAAVDPGSFAQFAAFESQINRISAADVNVGNAVSFTQTQDAALQSAQKALDRMGELSVMAQDSTKTDADRALLQQEFTQLQDFVSDVGGLKFNGVNLFSSSGPTVTTGPSGETADLAAVDVAASGSAGGLGGISGLSIATQSDASAALDSIKTAVNNLSNLRGTIGANQQQLNSTADTLSTLKETTSATASRMGDVDVAAESSNLAASKFQVQAGALQIKTANQLQQTKLSLLG